MRTIKFRGKRIDGKGFAFGSLILPNSENENTYIQGWNGAKFKVIPETVGQFTGLHDKNGKEIYEGDILAFENILNFKKVLQSHFVIKWEDYGNGMLGFTQFSPINNFVICGNIYQNPELLTD